MTQESGCDVPQTSSCILAKREKACGIIICALCDALSRVVMVVDDDPGHMLQVVDAPYSQTGQFLV